MDTVKIFTANICGFFRNGEWRINGVGFADVAGRILAKPERGTVELWELENSSGGWSHPVHIHLIDFQVVSRVNGDRGVMPYEAKGLKDVILLGKGETVRVLAKYAPWDGVYMFHVCFPGHSNSPELF